LAALGACDRMVKPYLREDVADRLAHPVWMVERQIPAGLFSLTAYERMHEANAPATIYIEGDGELTTDFRMNSKDPTPRNPVSLHLATKDKADNVAWIARPCQYYGIESCDAAYWGNERFAPEVVTAYSLALDEIKKRYDIQGFNLVGFDGGAAIATILAAQRDDVLTLRTVAGTLDTTLYASEHKIPALSGSLNPLDFAPKLANIPQTHYIGGQDKVISPALLHSYLQAVGPSNCVQYHFIQEAEHDQGWVEKWPGFLTDVPTCKGPAVLPEPDYISEPELPVIQPENPGLK
jgi:pimeloyl-ACP methyl ester carboxylesterase